MSQQSGPAVPSMNQYAEAEPLYLRSLKINEAKLGPDHPYVALTLNNLALLYKDMGENAKSESLLPAQPQDQ